MCKLRVFKAIIHGDICALTIELEENPHLASASAQWNWTVMHEAAQRGRATMIELLVKKGSTAIDTLNNANRTPMFLAAEKGHALTIEMLVQMGSQTIDSPNEGYNWTPMHTAALNGHVSVIEMLVRLGSTSIDTSTGRGWTPMHAAASRGHISVIETLIQLGSTSIDTLDMRGESPLYIALMREKWECVEVLKAHGADRSIARLSSLTPKHLNHLDKPTDESESAETRYRAYFNQSCVSRLLSHLDTAKRSSSPSTRHLLE
mgnify:CR=1 FL=1